MMFYVYILQMRDGRLYVGHSNNPPRRHAEHEQGKGCRITGIFGAGEIIYVEEHPDRPSAANRERQIKGWTRAKKLALAAGTRTNELSRGDRSVTALSKTGPFR
jgi:predicted GIY-YIG superfamily endonuclease